MTILKTAARETTQWEALIVLMYSGQLYLRPTSQRDVAAAWKRSHQWCVSLTPNNTKTIVRMTCHEFLRPIRRDLPSSSYAAPSKTPFFSTPIQTLYFYIPVSD